MPNAFNFSVSPFDCLDASEQRLVRDQVNVAYFRPGEVLLDAGDVPQHLFVLIKGYVQQFDGSELLATYGPDDSFDGRALVAGRAGSRFVAVDEVLAYELSHEAVPADMDIVSVVRLFQAEKTSNVLVRDDVAQPPRWGIFTTSGLQRAILDGRPLDRLSVGELASWELITVRPDDQVGEALVLMQRHGVHRVVVQDDGKILGLLESLDLFGFLSNHSMLIDRRLRAATDLDALARAAAQMNDMIRRQYRGGTRVALLARLVQDLNGRLFEQAWQLIAPPELVQNSCLLVMGSEGRGEQLLKTDQDNALLLRDGYVPPDDLPAICARFSEALACFGYPPCPGNVMLSNVTWRGTVQDFARRVRKWLVLPEADSLINLAVFMDAHAVCGDAELLASLRRQVFGMLADDDAMMSRFAAVVDAFGDGTRWWRRMLGGGEANLNVKKAGMFPLVHGVRSMALAESIDATSTEARIRALQEAGALDAETAQELTESLHFFMGLRLKAGLDEMERGQPVSGKVDLAGLTPLERDLLKDALAAVRRFRAQLRLRFRLGAVS